MGIGVMDAKVAAADLLAEKFCSRNAVVGIIGLGYVGLPLATAAARCGFTITGFDIDRDKVNLLNNGKSYVDAVSDQAIASYVDAGKFSATCDLSGLENCDVIVICVPTPLSKQRDPDLSYIKSTAETISTFQQAGQLVVLGSTTWPGTTLEIIIPILESRGLKSGRDFWVGYSPEREDPGNRNFDTSSTARIVSGDGDIAQSLITSFYSAFVNRVVPVSKPTTAEAVKITENVFRAVNIALANEMKMVYGAMGIDVWEVIDAASTKPFGFMPFYPGPGLGGHCIPIDPFYLAWKAREYSTEHRFVQLAGEINISMPKYVVARLGEALDDHFKISVGASKILILGLAYKKNTSDIRESPALKIIELLEKRGAKVQFHDPNIAEIPRNQEHAWLTGRKSLTLSAATISKMDAVLIVNDHDAVDYEMVAKHAQLVVDTRNTMRSRKLQCRALVLA